MSRRPRSWLPFARAALLLGLIFTAELAILEAALRTYGGSEAASSFQALFMQDPRIGHRLRPGTETTYTTVEFSTHLAINAQGVRDDEPIGPKAPGERRIVLLGDSLVLAVQVPFAETFGERLETRLNAADPAHTWRVINAGVQGYGPVEDWLFFEHVAAAFEPDIVLPVVFVGNDAVEAGAMVDKLETGAVPVQSVADTAHTRLRVLVRRSQVLQLVRVRVDQLRAKFSAAVPELPLASYLDTPPAAILDGFQVAREAFGRIAARADSERATTAFVLMPARFQTDDVDFGRLDAIVAGMGGTLRRQLATERFHDALAPLGRPMLDLLPILWAQPDRGGLFFERNVHLTPRGHRVVADALFDFLDGAHLIAARPD